VPVISARAEAYEAITGGEESAWLFEPGHRESLVETFRRAAGDPDGTERRAEACARRIAGLSWEAMAARTAALFDEALGRETVAPATALEAA
jgi:glycosyltransferase involved in cell wall biosynthesis